MPDIIKSDGSVEAFDASKLRDSLLRAGAGENAATHIADSIAASVSHGARTHDLYRRAFTMLRAEAKPIAARYSLRRALMELGPTGHPFEDFVSHIFVKEGWSVETRKLIQGKCVVHETDFYAHRSDEHLAAELKYHNDAGYRTDVKVALYVKSRFDDIFQCDPTTQKCPINRGMLITNTKFTSQAIQYAECAGVELIGWNYPARGNLYDRMCETHVYPLTALISLQKNQKRLLIESGVIACDQLRENRTALKNAGLSPEEMGNVLAEADALIALPHPYA